MAVRVIPNGAKTARKQNISKEKERDRLCRARSLKRNTAKSRQKKTEEKNILGKIDIAYSYEKTTLYKGNGDADERPSCTGRGRTEEKYSDLDKGYDEP